MSIDWMNFTPWAALGGGVLIGLASVAFVLLLGRIAGISGIVGELLRRPAFDWRAAFLCGLVAAPLLFRLAGGVADVHFVAGWPLIGWMAARADTIFHQRGSQESLGGVMAQMAERLRDGHSVGAFPEGGTRGGKELGPFHARIFTAAVEASAPVQPVALRYGEGGSAQTRVAFGPRENFVQNFLRLLGDRAIVAEVVFLEPILPGDAEGRRRIADTARARIAAALGYA